MMCRTIASDVKLCSNMPRAVNRPIMEENETLALVERDEGRFNETKHTESSSVDATSASDPDDTVVSASDDHSEGTGAVNATNNSRRKLLEEIECPTSPTRVAFITPFLPRHDGLAYYAEQLIRSSTQACPTITFDVFAVVLDFFSAYSETYNESDVRHVIFRESWVDYISAARVINEEYDAALINFKLGAFGGSSCAYAVCLVKSISKPVISIVHSINHHMDDELQVSLC